MLTLPDFRQKHLILTFPTEGQKISFKNDNIIIKDRDERILLQLSCHKIFSLWVVGHTTITSGLLQRSQKYSFQISLFSINFRKYGSWESAVDGNFVLRKKQYSYSGLELAKHLVVNKIKNQAFLLREIRNKDNDLREKIHRLEECSVSVQKQDDVYSILGIEGVAARIFFSQWFKDFNWSKRQPRVKHDVINAVLDMGYTYLFNMIEAFLSLYGFDLYQGVYHKSFYQRKSLVCDLIEPFRCIVDKQVRKSLGLGQIKIEDFNYKNGQYLLKIEHNKKYGQWLVQGILEHKESIFKYVQDYYRGFMRDREVEKYPMFLMGKKC